MALARHIQIARENGPAAGLRAYLRTNAPTSADRRADILSADDRLVRYCQIFKAELGLKDNVRGTAARAKIDDDEKSSLYQRFLAFIASEDEPGASIQVVDEPTPTQERNTRQGTGRRTSRPAPPEATLAKGDSFLYHGTNSVSEWTVVSVHKAHVKASNGNGRVSSWKHATVTKLVADGKIDLI